MSTSTKYILHYCGYGNKPNSGRNTKTYLKLESAISDLNAYRNFYRTCFEENDMRFYNGSNPITDEQLDKNLGLFFYIEKQTTESERLDY